MKKKYKELTYFQLMCSAAGLYIREVRFSHRKTVQVLMGARIVIVNTFRILEICPAGRHHNITFILENAFEMGFPRFLGFPLTRSFGTNKEKTSRHLKARLKRLRQSCHNKIFIE